MGTAENALKQVEQFAGEAHGKQQRKYSSEPYIVHPVRVKDICRKHSDELPVLAAALLHDVLEDTPVTPQQLGDFLATIMSRADAKRTLDLVVELTDVYVKKDYPQLNRRKRKALEQARMEQTSAAAQTIKYADIIDNCREILNHDPDFGKVFVHECRQLLARMNKGNEKLYREALQLVDYNINSLKGGGNKRNKDSQSL